MIKFVTMLMFKLSGRKIGFSLFLSFLFLVGSVFAQSDTALHYSEKISEQDLKSDLTWLASPGLMGRGTPSAGLNMAANYIRKKFKENGLIPFFPGYFQKFYWPGDTILPQMKIGHHTYRFGIDYYTNFKSSNKDIKSEEILIVSGNKREWSDSAGKYSGKVLILLSENDDSVFLSVEKNDSLIREAETAGAAALLIPVEGKFGTIGKEKRLELNQEIKLPLSYQSSMPVIFIHKNVINELFGKGSKKGFLGHPFLPFAVNRKFKLTFKNVQINQPVYNVAGMIRGKDTLHYLVIGAHYDHLGQQRGVTYFGADDNASGTVAVLQLAKVFSQALREGFVPEKNLLFVAFSAEEKGLIGSDYFVSKMSSKMKVDAMINMDMIGRRDDIHGEDADYVYVLGQDYNSKFWKNPLKEAGRLMPGLKPDYSFNRNNDPESLIQRSDQYPFLQKRIPVLFFYDNMQADYHVPGDISAKIDWLLLKKRTQFIFLICWQLVFAQVN